MELIKVIYQPGGPRQPLCERYVIKMKSTMGMAQAQQGMMSPDLLLNPSRAWRWAANCILTTGTLLAQGMATSLGFSCFSCSPVELDFPQHSWCPLCIP